MSGEQQFSAVHLGVGEVAIGDDRRRLGIVRMPDEATAEAFVRNFNRPDRDPLPEGVHEAPDGTLLWHSLVCSLPEGYEAFRNGCWGPMGHDPRHDWWYAVRPIPQTEQVHWSKALRQHLTVISTEDTHIEVHHAWVNGDDMHVGRLGVGSAIADENNGQVEVLK